MPRASYDPPPPELVRLGAALKAMREERDLKQIEVANRAEMTEPYISHLERGRNSPGWLVLLRLLTYGLDATLDDLVVAYKRVEDEQA